MSQRRSRAIESDDALWWMKFLYQGHPPEGTQFDAYDLPEIPGGNDGWDVITVVVEHNVGVRGITMSFRLKNSFGLLEDEEA